VIGFDLLGLPRAVFEVRRDNEHTIAFHRRFGAVQTGETEAELFFDYPRDQFEADRGSFVAIFESEGSA
jgi:RimJ/RimL family protein N-acetyltransferase